MKFIRMTRPLDYPVYNNTKVMIPAGAENVKIAFRQSHLSRRDEYDRLVRMNVYIWKGMVVHA